MEIKQLEYFLQVAHYSSLTRAADALYTTQPHVSAVIKSLEDELGVKLFRRVSKGMELTEEGINIYSYAEKVLQNSDLIRQVSSDTGKTWLKIASNPSSYMAALLTSYYPKLEEGNITLKFTECGLEQMMDMMVREHYDLGFAFAPVDRKLALDIMAQRRHLEYVELFRSELVLHAAPSHPYYGKSSVMPKELENVRFVQHDEDYFTIEELLQKKSNQHETPGSLHRVIYTNSDHMMIQMLKSGKVCNLGSYWLQDKFREFNFSAIPVEGYDKSVSFGYLKHKNIPLSPVAADFMTYILKTIGITE